MSAFVTSFGIAPESIVFFCIGFLLAALLGVTCFPLVHNRATRLTTRRIEAATPCSMEEIQAEKDSMRAEFAIATRRFETTMEDLRAKTCAQVTELTQKSDTISRLESELDTRSAKMLALEKRASAFDAREHSLVDQVRASRDDVSRLKDALRVAEKSLVDQRLTRQKIGNVIVEFSRLVSHKRKEIIAMRDDVDTIRHHANEIADCVKASQHRPPRERIDVMNGSRVPNMNGGRNSVVNGGTFENAGTYNKGGSDAALTLARK
jgi:chromosome segregation ATPase